MSLIDTCISILPNELVALLFATDQDPKWHKEGNVLNHTKQVFALVVKRHGVHSKDALSLLMAALFHDMGKIDTTVRLPTGEITAHEHESKANKYIYEYFDLFNDRLLKLYKPDTFMDKLKLKFHPQCILNEIKSNTLEIAYNHMRIHLFLDGNIKKQGRIKNVMKLKTFNLLVAFSICDSMGRKPQK